MGQAAWQIRQNVFAVLSIRPIYNKKEINNNGENVWRNLVSRWRITSEPAIVDHDL